MQFSRALLYPLLLATAVAIPVASTAAQVAPPAATSPAASPHPHHHHRWRRRPYMEAMRSVGLSAAQKAQIKTLMVNYRRAHPTGSPRDPQARAALRASVMKVLTAQQQAAFKTKLAQLRAQRRERITPQPQATPTP